MNSHSRRSKRERVAERDGWVCALCGEPIDPRLRSWEVWGATIDHIKPVCCGGGHDLENLQLAHRWCNLSRGTSDLDVGVVA